MLRVDLVEVAAQRHERILIPAIAAVVAVPFPLKLVEAGEHQLPWAGVAGDNVHGGHHATLIGSGQGHPQRGPEAVVVVVDGAHSVPSRSALMPSRRAIVALPYPALPLSARISPRLRMRHSYQPISGSP